jgi:UDP-glucose 4-epimerase
MKVLITGGAGYIGSVVVAELLRANHEVTVYDDLSHGYRKAVPSAAKFVQGEVADRAKLDSIFSSQPIDAVMHFAAFIEAGESMKFPERFFRNNSASTLTLLEAMLAHKIKNFVFSSTAALYGDPENIPIRETDTLKPTNAYGESKLLVERMLDWFHRIHGFRYASLRYFNAAGATAELGEAHQPESHLIPLILQVALGKRDAISIFGTDYPTHDGTCVRDYIHVGFSVREVVEVARKVTGHPIPVIEAPRRAGDPATLVASSEIIRDLGWKPRFAELEQIVSSAWEWHKKHPAGY